VVTAIAGVVAIVVGVTTWVVAMLTIREKLRAPKPHPLDARLADISQAIRDLRT
jgi:hypothetical protein